MCACVREREGEGEKDRGTQRQRDKETKKKREGEESARARERACVCVCARARARRRACVNVCLIKAHRCGYLDRRFLLFGKSLQEHLEDVLRQPRATQEARQTCWPGRPAAERARVARAGTRRCTPMYAAAAAVVQSVGSGRIGPRTAHEPVVGW